jgi:hypothetical protein
MSFNSVTLTIASIIFVVLLAMTAYFIFQDQKSKFRLIQSTCPDYWLLRKYNEGPNQGKFYCEPNSKNLGTCSSEQGSLQRPSIYTVLNDAGECSNYKNKMTWVNNVCGRKILWDGVTNNAELRNKCK